MPTYDYSPDRTMLIYLNDEKTVVPMRDIDTFTYHDVLNYNQQMKYDNWSTSRDNQVHESMVDHVDFRKKQAADVRSKMIEKIIQKDAISNLTIPPETQYEVGNKYLRGDGVNQDYAEAIKWFRLAAKQRNSDAQYNLGQLYETGTSVPQSYSEALVWYRLAASQGHLESINSLRVAANQGNSDAQYYLGHMYENGLGVPKDTEEAIKWYRLAAKQENNHAQFNLGRMYNYGRGVRRNYDEAVKWYRLAADQGNADAPFELGYMYDNYWDTKEAVKWWKLSAERGHAKAQLRLGEIYLWGYGFDGDGNSIITQDYDEAIKWYRLAAEQGNVNSQYKLGEMYEDGHGVTQNYSEAVKWYRLAADQGYAGAQCNLGKIYSNGLGVVKNYDEAVKWYRLAADQGYAGAQYNLGFMYANGYGVTQDYDESVKWYSLAADQGSYNAQLLIDNGFYYEDGPVFEPQLLLEQGFESLKDQDYDKALKLFRLGADHEDCDAQNQLGYMYETGEGVTQDYNEAVKWFRLAADQGDDFGQFNLGRMYEYGRGVRRNYVEAIKWYSLAAEQGSYRAQNNLGIMYEEGLGVTQDYNEAIKWYRLAAEQGSYRAQYNLGIMYENDFGVAQDYAEAVKWYRLAADQGNAEAQNNLGHMYQYGQGVAQNYDESINWYRLAADQGNAWAQNNLGYMYQYGHGVNQDYSEAIKWYRLAAEQGDAVAQCNLGEQYQYGHGVPQDCAEAGKWYRLAAEQGDEEAKKRLLELEANSQPEDHPKDKFPPSPKTTHLDTKSSDPKLNKIIDEINKLIGLERVKKEIYQIMQLVRIREMRKTKGLKIDAMSLHSVFLGSPGTGKTTVARIYGQILNALGLLSKGHLVETDRSGLVAGYVGQTEIKTDAKIKESLGGILFIDEAYSLSKGDDAGWDYGSEAISILLKRMEDHRDDLVVIVAGYDNPMEKFLRSNEGLKSRFSRHIHFDDFSTDELVEIFQLMCSKGGYEIGTESLELTRTLVSKAYSRRDESFGNARYVRNLFEDVVRNQNVRLAESTQDPSHKDLITILPDDIPKGPQVCRESLEELIDELNKLIGLDQVKSQIYELTQFVRIQQMRRLQGLSDDPVSLHGVFFGNPGTGKTTVARIYGKLLNAMGLLSRGHVVETDRSGLVAGYIGQTEGKTDEKVREALGGILFIDEAYSLAKGEDSQNDFGNEAISILLKRMEDHRDDFVVIVAGYDKPMAELLESNEGLKSRFSTHIHFPDYSPKELLEIFELFCKEKHYQVQSTALELMQYILENEYRSRDETFGNGRLVRNLFESVKKNQAVRLAESPQKLSLSDLVTILPDDVRPLLNKKQEPVTPRY